MGDHRTAGERMRDLRLSCVDKFLTLVLFRLEKAERSAGSRKSYIDAEEFRTLHNMITGIQKDLRGGKDD